MEKNILLETVGGISIERVRRDSAFTMSGHHFHPDFEIYYLYEGRRSYFIEKHIYEITGGTLVFIATGKIHKTTESSENNTKSASHDRLLLLLDKKIQQSFQSMLAEMNAEDFFTQQYGIIQLKASEKKYIESIFQFIYKEIQNKSAGYLTLIKMRTKELLIFIIRKMSSASYIEQNSQMKTKYRQSHSLLEKVEDIALYISNHCESQISLEELASKFYISKYYLCRIFKASTGFTINEYLNMKRIQKSIEYLEKTNCSITTVSELSGYDTITHFERNFMKYMSQTPLRYRKQYQIEESNT